MQNRFLRGKPTQSIGTAALIVATAGIASRILGLVRDRILASRFGAGDLLDVYYAAFRIPDLIFDLLVLGALSAAFIPVFTHLLTHQQKDSAWRLASGVLSILVLVVIVVSAICALFAPAIVHIIVPGFTEEKLTLTALFTRIMFLSPLLLGISAVFGGILVSFKRFVVYALAPMMYNIGIIIGAVFLVKIVGPSGLAWGVVLGAFLHLLMHYPATRHLGFRYVPIFQKAYKDSNVRRVIILMVPRIFGTASNQIGFLIIAFFASTLASGSISVFSFANNIQSVVLGLVGIPFAVATFPTLSALRAKESNVEFVHIVSCTLRRILFYVVPLSILLIALRAQIVRVVLGSGNFDWEDTIMTFQVLGILSISLFAQSTIPLLARTFYAMHNTKIPFYIALFSQIVNIGIVILTIQSFGILGVAAAFSFASIVNMTLLLIVLHTKLHTLDGRQIIITMGKISFAALIATLAIQTSKHLIGGNIQLDTFFAVFVQLIVSGSVGIAAYLLVSYFLNIEEFQTLRDKLLVRHFGRVPVAVEDQSETK